MMNCTTLGIDLAKQVFQLHGVDERGRVVVQKGFVATFPLRGVPLCCSPNREVEERRHDRLQGESI